MPPDGWSEHASRYFRGCLGFDELSDLGPCVSVFGSARLTTADPAYDRCVETVRLLAEAGYGIITGGGPGIMEAANRGASEAAGINAGLNISLPLEQADNPYITRELNFELPLLLHAKVLVRLSG